MYTCEVCHQAFRRKFNFQRHMDAVHGSNINFNKIRKRQSGIEGKSNIPKSNVINFLKISNISHDL